MPSQKYLGCINGLVLCVDGFENQTIQGRLFNLYMTKPIRVNSMKDFFLEGEKLFNDVGNPRANQSDRDFDGNTIVHIAKIGVEKMKKDEEILEEHGEMGTFIVRVQHRQHSSWQGRVTWLDQDKTVYFRSELELMKLIDSALNDETFEEPKDKE